MPARMVAEILFHSCHYPDFVYAVPLLVTHWQGVCWPADKNGIYLRLYMFGYGMQRNNGFQIGVLPVDMDIAYAVRDRSDMRGIEEC